MKKNAAWCVRYALEQIGVKFTFGIPGVHNTEIYDELNKSESITPILTTHELSAGFMADGVSRTSGSIGTLAIVPAAGTTHAASGIGEAYLDGIPLLVISGGTRRDSGKSYQLHQIDQEKLVQAITKKFYLIDDYNKIVETIYEAYDLAISGEPGPVFIEIPAEFLLFQGEIDNPLTYQEWKVDQVLKLDDSLMDQVVNLLNSGQKIGLYVGWGARECGDDLIQLAEYLESPVSTTMQGLSVFPATHPLHTGMGFGQTAVPAARNAFKDCDTILAIGVRFGELATGSYSIEVPENLIHVDINPEVFNKNYPTKISVESDGKFFVQELNKRLAQQTQKNENTELREQIKTDKNNYWNEWTKELNPERVSPGIFFKELNNCLDEDSYVIADDGKHTFLCGELLKIQKPKHYACPTDYNAMGYCVPATIGCKLANPNSKVVGVVGDGALLMTGLEMITAATQKVGVVLFVFHDGELGMISQFQKIPLHYKTCTVLGDIKVEGIATATGCEFIQIENDHQVEEKVRQAFEFAAQEKPVIVDVLIDYSKKTSFAKGVVKANLSRFPLKEKVRFISRAIKRHTIG